MNKTDLEKKGYKKLVSEACFMKDEEEIKNKMETMTKMKELKLEDCKMKSYIRDKSLYEVRDIFRIRIMMNNLKGNLKGKYENQP